MIGAHIGPFSTSGGIAQAGLDFDFRANLYQKIDTDGTDMARTSTLSDLITVSRASKKTNAGGWDFISGSAVGALTEVNNNEAARDSVKGLLVEEGSTNEISNPRFEGATPGVVGSGGVVPTDYLSAPDSATLEVIGTGTENGWPYLELEYTAAGAAFPQLYGSAPTASAGQTWTSSWGVKVISSTGGFLGHNFKIREYNGGTITNDTLSSGYQEEPSVHSRGVFTATLTDGATTSARGGLLFGFNAAGSVRVRIYAPQLEQKEFPTSPILPPVSTPGSATRSVDFASVPAGAWAIDDAPCSLYVLAYMINGNKAGSFGRVVSFGQNSSNEAALIFNATNNVVWSVRVGGTVQAVQSVTNTMAAGTELRTAIGLETNSIAISSNGVTQAVDTSGTINFGDSVLSVNASPDEANRATGCWIETIQLFPERLTNAQLEALVGN